MKTMKKIIVFLALMCFSCIAFAQGSAQKAASVKKPRAVKSTKTENTSSGQRVYSVWIWQESGDCLWNIARKYYGDPYKWRKIYDANRDKISNPNVIFPRQKFVIPFLVDEKIVK